MHPINEAWEILKYLGDEGERAVEYQAEYDAARRMNQGERWGPDDELQQDMAGENEAAFQDHFQSMGPNDLKHLYDMIEAYKEQARYKDQLIDALRNQLSVLQGQTPEEMYSPQQLDTQRPSNLTGGRYSHLLPETNFE